MAVYVDDMRANFGRMIMCHMIADTEAELHAMADRIGVARKWYQGDHYDIALSKRAKAVEFGAREITWKQCGCMVALRKRGQDMGAPDTAAARLLAFKDARRLELASNHDGEP
jgi:hypothetical protein